jgi:hypothetical protein
MFIPPPQYRVKIRLKQALSLRQLCELAHVQCRASGAWVERKIEIVRAKDLQIIAEPGSWGNVRIEIPDSSYSNRFALALNILAYGLHDLVARESIRGTDLSVVRPHRGRPRRGSAKSNRQRQRELRRRWSLGADEK